jgi:hypothetical protein
MSSSSSSSDFQLITSFRFVSKIAFTFSGGALSAFRTALAKGRVNNKLFSGIFGPSDSQMTFPTAQYLTRMAKVSLSLISLAREQPPNLERGEHQRKLC